MWFFRSPSIVYGEDSLSFLNEIPQRNILIITDKNIVNAGLLKKVEKELPEDSKMNVIDTVPVEPTISYIRSLKSKVESFIPDLIIGLGGGSCMDCAKVAFVSYERPDIDLYEITPLINLNLRNKAKLILIPTTSGTGSECSWAAVISDDDHGRKNEFASPEIIADYAILDPELVKALPPSLRKSTAIDALTHAVEARSSSWKNPYSDIFSDKAVELIANNLQESLSNPENIEAVMNVHMGASMAGLAFSNSQITLAHSLGHSLGARFNIPHGVSVGIFLPHVVRFNYNDAKEEYSALNKKFPSHIRKRFLYLTIESFLRSVEMPMNLKDLGINKNEFEEGMDSMVSMALESTGTVLNPRDAGRAEIEMIFKEIESS
ncbi:MAG: iron-containing alcohol dehydrogenase [Thermoplasmataceae archaeon]